MPKFKKLPYQLEAVKKIEHFRGRVLLADEMGLGKTVEALLWVKHHPKKKPVIIVCPASLKWMWETFIHEILKTRCGILNGTTPPKRGLISQHDYLIINYEILQHWVDVLKKLNPKILIIDECHYIKNHKAQRTKAVHKLKDIPYIIALSGTPLTNRPAELWNVLHLLRPELFKDKLPYQFSIFQLMSVLEIDASEVREARNLLKEFYLEGYIKRLSKNMYQKQ